MRDDIAIRVDGLTKAYRIWDRPSSRLIAPAQEMLASCFSKSSSPAHYLRSRAEGHYRDFYALRDISFQLRRGESIGIIGRNGSGKSTLLQIIAGTLQPTAGTANLNGRVAALLELGSGFNPEFTGRENVFLYGAVLGLSKLEVEEKFEAIAAFADIGSFIDQPVKTFSSGMVVRLAFAVAVSFEPEILIIDEALSVGDVFFQQKCFQRIHEIINCGTTFLLVSHDISAVQNLCDRAILLENGKVSFDGPPADAASRYFANPAQLASRAPTPLSSFVGSAESPIQRLVQSNNILAKARSRAGDGRLVVEAAMIESPMGINLLEASVGDRLRIYFMLLARTNVNRCSFGIHLYDRMNECIFAAGARNLGARLYNLRMGEVLFAYYDLTLSVAPGQYTLSIGCSADSPQRDTDSNVGAVDDRHDGIGPLSVHWPAGKLLPFYGKARLDTAIAYVSNESA